MNKFKAKMFFAMGLCVLIGTLSAGCGSEIPGISAVEKSTIYLTKDGTVTEFLVEAFEKDYYDVTELEQMILMEIEDYNSQANAGNDGSPVRLITVYGPQEKNASLGAKEETTVTVQMEYADAEEYGDFNGCVMYFGTIADAKNAGYPIKADVTDITTGEALAKEEAQKMTENHVLVLQGNIPIVVPYKVLYVSPDVRVEGNTVIFDGADGSGAVVIMK